MAIKGILYVYILIVASVSLVSYKKGIYVVWLTLLLTPLVVLQTGIKMRLSLMTILLLGSVISELRFRERRTDWMSFISSNQKAIILYLTISFSIVFFSQTVPIGYQLRRVFDEIVMLLFALQTFLLFRDDDGNRHTTVFMRIICGVLLFNFAYFVFFELIMGINPAGLPLYMFMGVDDNENLVDMIEVERGAMSFRAQTVYGHPLSLGQYMLAFLPLFIVKKQLRFRMVYILIICVLVVMTGTRGAMAPMFLIIILGINRLISNVLPKIVLLLIAIVLTISFIPDRQWRHFSKSVEPFVASILFWDDKKQYANDIGGSSMEMRFSQFDAALKETSANPLFGRGYGYREYWQKKHNGLHPDLLGYESLLIYYLVERGWIGLFLFFAMAFFLYRLFRNNTLEIIAIKLIFIAYLLSIIMTGVRHLTFLFVCLASSIVCGTFSKSNSVDKCITSNA